MGDCLFGILSWRSNEPAQSRGASDGFRVSVLLLVDTEMGDCLFGILSWRSNEPAQSRGASDGFRVSVLLRKCCENTRFLLFVV